MSGTASFVATVKAVWMGNSGSGTWTLTDNANASIGLLPTSQASDSELIPAFQAGGCHGAGTIHLELSDDLSPGSWTTSIPVPAASGDVGGVTFQVTGPSDGLDDVYAHISFGRDARWP